MTKIPWITRTFKIMLMLVPGMAVLGSYCTLTDIRDNIVAGGLSFVKGTATDVFEAFIPVADWLP